MDELNEPMEVIHKPMKNIPGDYAYCLPNSSVSSYACQDKSNLRKHCFKNKQINFGKQIVDT